jgi:hypothetical protein
MRLSLTRYLLAAPPSGRLLSLAAYACARQQTKKTKKNIGLVFLQKKQEHGEAGTAKQGTEQSL